ncbi:MAG: hypothetical protein JWO38_3631 [Gemmataceae bacterium]|nr:hypothetical protein [Gemmataceae bacterium]
MNDPDEGAVIRRLDRIESLLTAVLERETVRAWYTTEEVARLVS